MKRKKRATSRAAQRNKAVEDVRTRRGRPRGTGPDTVYQNVRARILDLRLRPGADISEVDLVKQCGVSRTPVREALIRLASEGLVTLLPNVGARVASLGADEVPQILEALELVQRVTSRWAATRRRAEHMAAITSACEQFSAAIKTLDFNWMGEANRAFHLAIGKSAGNPLWAVFHESVESASLRISRLAFAQAVVSDTEYREYYAEVDRQHWQLLAAIDSRDAELADSIAKQHLALFRARIIRYLRESLASEVPLS